MKRLDNPDDSRRRLAFTAACLLVVALVLCPAMRAYAADGTGLPQARSQSWLTQASALWTDLWTALTDLFPARIAAATTTGGTTTSSTSTDPTTGDGGLDPGGDGGLQDPNGGFGF